MAKEKVQKEDRNYNVFERFFFLLLIPTIFAIIFTSALVVLVLYMNGYDVKNTLLKIGKQIPYVAQYVPEPDAPKTKEQLTEEMITKLRSALSSRLSDLSIANRTIDEKNSKIDQLNTQITDLGEKLKKKTLTDDEYLAQIKGVANMYGNMPAGKVAPIIENLTLPEIVLMLGNMSEMQRTAILEKMDPKKAAESSILLKDQTPAKDQQIAALQSRINAINPLPSKGTVASKLTQADIATTFTTMPPKTASDILQTMLITDEKQVISILISMDNASRSKILAQMPVETAASLAGKLK